MENDPKIYFIGFMSSGKSMWSARLAEKWKMKCVDLDKEIEERAGVSITTLFQDHGEDYFRRLESRLLHEYAAEEGGYIMATGGGTPCFINNLDVINDGISIYLKVPRDVLMDRLRRMKGGRPLIARLSDGELTDFIERTLEVREIYYEQATIVVDEPKLDLEVLESEIRNQLK